MTEQSCNEQVINIHYQYTLLIYYLSIAGTRPSSGRFVFLCRLFAEEPCDNLYQLTIVRHDADILTSPSRASACSLADKVEKSRESLSSRCSGEENSGEFATIQSSPRAPTQVDPALCMVPTCSNTSSPCS